MTDIENSQCFTSAVNIDQLPSHEGRVLIFQTTGISMDNANL
jgi:hypothetical protein